MTTERGSLTDREYITLLEAKIRVLERRLAVQRSSEEQIKESLNRSIEFWQKYSEENTKLLLKLMGYRWMPGEDKINQPRIDPDEYDATRRIKESLSSAWISMDDYM